MRILVLGGTAFLSAEVTRQAVAAAHEVTCLARGTSAAVPDGATWVRADRTVGAAAFRELDGHWDEVVEVSRDPVPAQAALDALAGRAGHWTFVSSCSVYADPSVPGATEDAQLLEALPDGQHGTPETYGESKAAIELMTRRAAGEKAHIVRAGLIGGPGDASDRYGYWPARFAATAGPVLVPDIPDSPTQIVDVRDVAAWILLGAERGLAGTFNAVGEVVPFASYIAESLSAAGATEEVVAVGEDWLVEQGVDYWAGPDSLPLWLPPGHEGFQARSNAAAVAEGLALRPWQETLRDTLEDERHRGLDRERKAGLSRPTERRLLARWKDGLGQ
jgi:nucleoside-diphosphate-sugar epimerase